MKLRDFFLLGMNNGMCKKKAWMNLLFTKVLNPEVTPNMPFKPFFEDNKMYFYMPGREDQVEDRIYIEDYIPDQAPLAFRDEFILNAGEIVNYKSGPPIRTTYGNIFVNQLALVLPFGDLFEFKPGKFNLDAIESEIERRLIDDPLNDPNPPMATDGKIYVWQYRMFADHCLAIPGYADGTVTSVTEKSMLSSPDRDKVRNELIEKYKDQLSDPAIIAEIGKQLTQLDVDWLKDDESFEFYSVKFDKLFGGIRRKVFYMFGGEAPFKDGTSVEFISKSLEEGIDTDHMPVMNNSLRYGSYNRGAQTALGGESTKTIYRMVGTVRIIMPDCKSWIGVPIYVYDYNKKDFIGYTHLVNGQSVEITNENIDSLVNTQIFLRTPITCKAGGDIEKGIQGKGKNVCGVCMGKAIAENPHGIPAASAGVGGRFLSLFLSMMHSSTLKTVPWDLEKRLT